MKKLLAVILLGLLLSSYTSDNSPVISVSPTAMNVLYIGLENPICIAVSGIPSEYIYPLTRADMQITKTSEGHYNVTPRRGIGSSAIIEIYANNIKIGETTFRIKNIPPPVAKVGGRKGGGIAKSMLLAQRYVVADMENFDFDLSILVTRFTVSATVGGFLKEETAYGNQITVAQKNIIANVDIGRRVYFQDIVVQTPAGPRELSTISFRLR